LVAPNRARCVKMVEIQSQVPLLVVVPELPWPPRRNGLSLRFAPIVEYLSARYVVDLIVLGDDPPFESTPSAFGRCRDIRYLSPDQATRSVGIRKLRTILAGLDPYGEPFGAIRHQDWSRAVEILIRQINRANYHVVLWVADYKVGLAIRRATPKPRFVFDFVDSWTLHSRRSRWRFGLLKIAGSYTTWKWMRIERRVRDAVDASIYISAVDSQAVKSTGPENVFVIPNGVYVDDAVLKEHDYDRSTSVIGFLGNMSYEPNIHAAHRLIEQVLPRVLLRHPDARVLIIGRNPAPSVQSLRSERVTLSGTVAEIWPFMAKVDAFVFPMASGAGLQNKILEAMYARIPVVTSSLSWESVRAAPGVEILVADTDDQMALRTTELLLDTAYRRAVGTSGGEFVRRAFGWPEALRRYELVLFGAEPSSPKR
jgi:glycosyltransferase involved in cell wall biosynthesis